MALTAKAQLSISQAAWEQLAYFALRPELYFDSLAEIKPTNQSNVGTTVTFTFSNELSDITAALTEGSDATVVQIGNNQVTVTLAEYGSAVQTTAQLRATAFYAVNPVVANLVGWNAGSSTDGIARSALATVGDAYANRIWSGAATTTGTVASTHTLAGNEVRKAVARLRSGNSPTFGGVYKGIIHPDISYDFRGATGGTNWSDPHVYSDATGIYNGVIGSFQGVQFMESPRAPLFVDAGVGGTVDVYGTLIMGRQALAKAYCLNGEYGQQPILVDVPVIDVLRRFTGVGWKHFVGYKIFRPASYWRIESASSIGTN